MNKYFLTCLTILASLSLSAADTPKEGYLSSTNASYDGSALILTGHDYYYDDNGQECQPQLSPQNQTFPHNSAIVPHKYLDSL